MHIYFVRHGQKDVTKKDTLHEHYHRPLTEIGELQAKKLGEYMKTKHIHKIYSSDMNRAVLTAELANEHIYVPSVIHTSALRETSPVIDINNPDADKIKIKCWYDWDYKVGEAESYNEGKARFERYFYKDIIANAHADDAILIITHGRVLRLFLSDYLPNGKEIIRNIYKHVAITHAIFQNNQLNILAYNDQSYLPAELH
jgi:broad specificity phosphatase PhoE